MSKDEALKLEKVLIKLFNTMTPNGYNVSIGGDYCSGVQQELTSLTGTKNGRSLLNEKEVAFIKNNRDQPLSLLYKEFQNRFNKSISYESFKKVYDDKTYKEIVAPKSKYANNRSFSNMIRFSSIPYEEIVELRKKYANHVYWKEAYEPYKDKMTWESFWQLYNGYGAKGRNIMPEVFTEENKRAHSRLKAKTGSSNPKAKLSECQVKDIRSKYDNGVPLKIIYKEYSHVSTANIRDICNRKTWKHIP